MADSQGESVKWKESWLQPWETLGVGEETKAVCEENSKRQNSRYILKC